MRSNIERRNPALIVLAYGTNEAGRKDWTLDTYRDMFSQLIAALPRGRAHRHHPGHRPSGPRSTNQEGLGADGPDRHDLEAQRQAALANGCPFWDLRAKMGGKGSMLQWVAAGMAQNDHVHFTGAGYHMLGDAVFRDLMSQYDVFVRARGDSIVHSEPAALQGGAGVAAGVGVVAKVAPQSTAAGHAAEHVTEHVTEPAAAQGSPKNFGAGHPSWWKNRQPSFIVPSAASQSATPWPAAIADP